MVIIITFLVHGTVNIYCFVIRIRRTKYISMFTSVLTLNIM